MLVCVVGYARLDFMSGPTVQMYPSRFASRNRALIALRSWFVVVAAAFCAT
jgi:hypothetical protein